jgi:serine/threonine protein kinase
MLPEARRRLAEIFDLVRELSVVDRAIYLDRECAGEPELRRQVEELVAHDQPEDDLLERPAYDGIFGAAQSSEGPPRPPFNVKELLDKRDINQVFRTSALQLESLPGCLLDQKYRIELLLGKGAMGAVFQATHLGTTRTVAVKVIVPKLAENAEFAQRFKREAEAAGRLRHTNVVNVTDFGVARFREAELPYLVMEYLDGQTLSSYLKSEPRPSFNFILDVIEEAALALDAAHAVGVVHRDLKPSNIWLEPTHRGGYNVKVLDFGIAKVAGPIAGQIEPVHGANTADEDTVVMTTDLQVTDLTASATPEPDLMSTPSSLKTTVGTVLGTPAYMAPEQCQGLPVDGRADIYSLAVICYEMLCCRLPFQSENFTQLVQMQVLDAPKSPHERDSSVPRAVADIVLKGLDKDPAQRPPSAGAFAAKLRAVTEGEPTLLQKSRDVYHSHTSYLLPLLLLCLLPVAASVIPLRWLARAAFAAKLAPAWVLAPGAGLICVALILCALQCFKAACMLVLDNTKEGGEVRLPLRSILSYLIRGLPEMMRIQLRSMLDLRPASFRDNLLWPVIWAKEHRTGKQAIDRSRELCRTLPAASIALMVRQYAPPIMGFLWFPSIFFLLPKDRNVLPDMYRAALSGASPGLFVFSSPLIFVMFYGLIGSAYSLLYGSALRCRGEGSEIAFPPASRAISRKGSSFAVRPATFLFVAFPIAILIAMLLKGIS